MDATPPPPPGRAPVILAGPSEISAYLRRQGRWAWWFFVALAIVAVVVALVAAPGEPAALGVAAMVIVLTALITLYSRAKLNKTWKGVVVRKETRKVTVHEHTKDRLPQVEIRHFIHVRTDAGKNVEVRVAEEALNRYYAEGDRVVKLRGLAGPVRPVVPGGAGLLGCASCGTVIEAASLTGGPAVCRRCKCPIPDASRF